MKFFILALCVATVAADWLSADEAGVLQAHWAGVKNDKEGILAAVFTANPDIQAKFPQFAGQDVASLKGTGPFTAHANSIVGLLDTYIGLLGNDGNAGKITAALDKMAGTHKPRGVTVAQLNGFKKAAVSYVKASGAAEKAYNAAFDAFIAYVGPKL
uniref:Globin n=1 Tax=Polypedilum nubifer TaxID=54969 RepID=V5YM49_9DIPT|nr:globin [Polypedilum nubifer]